MVSSTSIFVGVLHLLLSEPLSVLLFFFEKFIRIVKNLFAYIMNKMIVVPHAHYS